MSKIHSIMNELEAQELIAQGKYHEALPLLLKVFQSGGSIDRENLVNSIAVCYLTEKDYLNAKIYLEKALSLNGENTTSLYNLGFCCLSLREYQKAIDYFLPLSGREDSRPDLLFNMGLAFLGIKKTDQAVECFKKLAEGPTAPDLVYNAGITLIGDGFAQHARNIFIQYLAKAGNDIDATFGLGIAYSRLNEFRKAIECFLRVVHWDSKRYISAYVSLGMAYLQIGDVQKAHDNLKIAVHLKPDMAEAWYYLGVFYETSNQMDTAITSFRKAGELNRSMVEAWEKLGHLYLQKGNYSDSRICYKKAYKLTNLSRYAFKIALIFIVEKDYAQALEFLNGCLERYKLEAASSNPPDYQLLDIHENLAVCSYYLEDFEKAALYGERVLMSDVKKEFMLFVVGSSFMKLGKVQESKRYLLKGLQINPSDVNILYSMGILEGNMGNFEKADEFLSRASELKRDPDILYALALTRMKLSRNEEASELFEEYQSFHRQDPDILYKLGLLYIELRNYERAKEAFRETLAIRPDNQRAREYLKSLNS